MTLVTLQQAKKLKELGYGLTFTAFRYEKSTGDVYNSYDPLIQCQSGELFIKAPTVSEALEWFREVKGIVCAVTLSDKRRLYNIQWYDDNTGIDDHKSDFKILHLPYSLAESALLDEVMKYVEGIMNSVSIK